VSAPNEVKVEEEQKVSSAPKAKAAKKKSVPAAKHGMSLRDRMKQHQAKT